MELLESGKFLYRESRKEYAHAESWGKKTPWSWEPKSAVRWGAVGRFVCSELHHATLTTTQRWSRVTKYTPQY